MSERERPTHPLMELALALLVKGDDDAYWLLPSAVAAVDQAIVTLLVSPFEKRQSLLELAAFAYLLEHEKRSPTAGRAIFALLRQHARVLEIVPELREPDVARQTAKRAARRLGVAEHVDRAPMIDRPVDDGAVKLNALYTPARLT